MSLGLGGVGLLLHLDKRIGEGAADSHSRAVHGVLLHNLAEHDGGDNDDDDTLEGVEDRGSDGPDLGSESKRELVVQVISQTRREGVEDDLVGGSGALGGGMLPLFLDGARLLVEDRENSPHRREDVHNSIHVCRVHVLGLVSLQLMRDVLAKLSLECGHEVGEGSPAESEHVDLNTLALLDARKANTTNNDEKHQVGQSRLGLNGRNSERDQSSENRLASLDNLRKGDRAAAHRQNRSTMGASSEESNWEEIKPVLAGELGGFPDAEDPRRDVHQEHTNQQLETKQWPVKTRRRRAARCPSG
mmetsp:Transcript_72584/g.193961  ORF Transcript_72584/g.193961 Transcript_72584/m.193961 type:complete len:303 (+) Transcript_72584:115-1023(+)